MNSKIKKWYEEPELDEGVIISSRIRLARNIKKYNFPSMLKELDAVDMIDETVKAVAKSRISNEINLIDLNNLSEIDRNSMVAHHSISQQFSHVNKPRGVLLHNNETISIMINEEDHIRLQGIFAGDKIDEAYDLTNDIDNIIEENMEYAFDAELGYLTSCPTNVGTGLRASYMVHIPCLESSGQLNRIIPNISKLGLTVRGIYGEGSNSLGSIYQISNQRTIGKTEKEIIQSLKGIVSQIVEQEIEIQRHLIKNDRITLEDKLYRAYGILSNARQITSRESMELLSQVRFGFVANLLDIKKPKENIYQIMINTQANVLQSINGEEMNERLRDITRANYLRECFEN